MLNLRRKLIQTDSDLREEPRIEFHMPATIMGINTKACVVDFSLSGFYIETESSKIPALGQRINIALKFPDERTGITVKAEVVYQAKSGFGCKLYEPTPETVRVLERYFNIFSGTLPVAVSSEADCQIAGA